MLSASDVLLGLFQFRRPFKQSRNCFSFIGGSLKTNAVLNKTVDQFYHIFLQVLDNNYLFCGRINAYKKAYIRLCIAIVQLSDASE